MRITVNGEEKEFEGPPTLVSLLQALGVNTKSVAVERNLRIVGRTEIYSEPVLDGDTIEIIRLVGGG